MTIDLTLDLLYNKICARKSSVGLVSAGLAHIPTLNNHATSPTTICAGDTMHTDPFVGQLTELDLHTYMYWSISRIRAGRVAGKLRVAKAIKMLNGLEAELKSKPHLSLLQRVKALNQDIILGFSKKAKTSATISVLTPKLTASITPAEAVTAVGG